MYIQTYTYTYVMCLYTYMYGCGGETSTDGLTPWESNRNVGNVQGIKKCAQH